MRGDTARARARTRQIKVWIANLESLAQAAAGGPREPNSGPTRRTGSRGATIAKATSSVGPVFPVSSKSGWAQCANGASPANPQSEPVAGPSCPSGVASLSLTGIVFTPCAVQITSFSGLFDPAAILGMYPGATRDRSAKEATSIRQSQCCSPHVRSYNRSIMIVKAKGGRLKVTMGPKRAGPVGTIGRTAG